MLAPPPATDCPQFYYAAPLYRRLVLILICGLIAVPTVVVIVWHLLLGRPIQFDVRVTVVIGSICLVLSSLFLARIRIDRNGIAARRLVRWHLCRWHVIRRREPPTLCVGQGLWAGAPPRIRRLHRALQWLDERDGYTVYRWLMPAGTNIHLPDIPSCFRMQVMGLKWLELDRQGLKLEEEGHVRTWFWYDVHRVSIKKGSNRNPAVSAIRIDLCDGTRLVVLHSTITCECSCQCRRDYLLQQFFRDVLREDQVLIWAERGEPSTVVEAAFRSAATQRELRAGRMFAWSYSIGIGILLFFGRAVGSEQCMHLAIQLIAHGVFLGPAFWGVLHQKRAEWNMLQNFLDTRARLNEMSTV